MVCVGFDEADVVGQQSVEILEEVAPLVIGLLVLVIALFIVLFGIGRFGAQGKNDLTALDHRFEGDVLAELELEARRAKERLEDVGTLLKRNLLLDIQRDILVVQLEVHHGDVQRLAAFQRALTTVLHGDAYLNGVLVDLAVLVKERLGGDHEGAVVAPLTLQDHLGGEDLAALQEREFGVLAAGIPEAEHLDRHIAVGDLFQLRGLVAVLHGIGEMLVVKCEVEIRRLAVDVRFLTAHAEHVRLHCHGEVGDQHIRIQIQILVVGEEAFLLRVNVDVRGDLRFPHHCGEIDASRAIRTQIELVRGQCAVLFLYIRRDDDVHVRERLGARVFHEDEVIVGSHGIVGHLADDRVFIRDALAPRFGGSSLCRGIGAPALVGKFLLEARAKRFGGVVIDLFAHRGYGFGDVIDRRQIGAVAKGTRAYGKRLGRADNHLLERGIREECRVIELGDRGGHGVIDALDARGIAVQHVLALGVEHAVAVVHKVRVLCVHLNVFQRGGVDKQIVAVNTADPILLVTAEIALAERDAREATAFGKCLAADLDRTVVHHDLLDVFCAAECLRGDGIGHDRTRVHIVKGDAVPVFGRCKGCGELQQRHLVAAVKKGCVAQGAFAIGDGAIDAVRAAHGLRKSRFFVVVAVIAEGKGGDLGASAKGARTDEGNVVVDHNVTRELGIVEGAHADGGERFAKGKCGDLGVFKRRVAHVVDLVALAQGRKGGAVPKCV